MSFNPDQTKQAQEIIFSRKKNPTTHPPLFSNNSEIQLSSNLLQLVNYHSMNIYMMKFIRQTKVLVFFENCKQFYHVTVY